MVSAASRPRRTPSSLVASDFTLSRSRRRPSSPGARSELSGRSTRRVRRRVVRSGDGLQPGRSGSGPQRLESDADSILNALERSITARDHAGLSTTVEHRCVSCQHRNSTAQNCAKHMMCLNHCALTSLCTCKVACKKVPHIKFLNPLLLIGPFDHKSATLAQCYSCRACATLLPACMCWCSDLRCNPPDFA